MVINVVSQCPCVGIPYFRNIPRMIGITPTLGIPTKAVVCGFETLGNGRLRWQRYIALEVIGMFFVGITVLTFYVCFCWYECVDTYFIHIYEALHQQATLWASVYQAHMCPPTLYL